MCFRTTDLHKWKRHLCPSDGSKFIIPGLDYSLNPIFSNDYLPRLPARQLSSPTNSDPPLFCKKCDIRFTNDADYSSHMKSRHVGTFQCPLCDFSSEHERWLESHMSTHAAGAANAVLFKCHLCDYTCMHRARLRQHQNTHKGIRPYTCAVCNYTGNNMSNMYRHVRGKHQIFDLDVLKSYVVRQKPEDDRWLPETSHIAVSGEELAAAPRGVTSTPGRKKRSSSTSKEKELQEPEVTKKRKEAVDTQKHRDDIDRTLPKIFSCDTCYYTTRDQETLNMHVKTVHNGISSTSLETQASNTDDGSFATKLADIVSRPKEKRLVSNLVDFSKFRTPPDGIPRPPSSTPFKRSDLLISSTVRINGSAVAQYKCKVCKVKSFDRQQLLEHITVEHMSSGSIEHLLPYARKNKAYYCQLCDYETPVTVNLKGHYFNHHPDDNTFKPKPIGDEDEACGGSATLIADPKPAATATTDTPADQTGSQAALTELEASAQDSSVQFVADSSIHVVNEPVNNFIPESDDSSDQQNVIEEKSSDFVETATEEYCASPAEDSGAAAVKVASIEQRQESPRTEGHDTITLNHEDEISSQLLLVTARHMALDH